jgi:hypothetical protein
MKLGRVILAVVVVLLIGGAVLATLTMEPPTQRVEKVIPDDRLPR